ncbi:MAG: hypothetical protein NVS1B4_24920 [Gemmatimonadaceae bacterium]
MPEQRLVDLVGAQMLPALAERGLAIVGHEEYPWFDNAVVILASPQLRLRIIRERGQLFLDIGCVAEPDTWFDSAVVFDHLGLSANGGFHGRDEASLRKMSEFVVVMWEELVRVFGPASFSNTKKDLEAVRYRRAAHMFGFE